jgi:hypothetical protein
VESILHVPELYNDRIYGHKGTSFSCLKEVAEILGLGFSSNVNDTNDSMNHICANENLKDFILEDVLSYIYKDDRSFFVCFIDQWYNLNLIEVNSLIKKEINLEQVSWVAHATTELDGEKEKNIELLFFSNLPESDGRSNYIQDFEIINDGGRRSIKNGYRQNIMYYDKDNKNHEQYFIESLTTDGIDSDDRVIKGEKNEDHTKNTRNIHFESLFLENAHENYFFAKAFNRLNLDEINKFKVRFDMNGINFAVTNYMVIPIHLSNNSQLYADISGDNNDTNVSLSGNYIITGMKYEYDLSKNNGTKLSFIGKRREIRKKFLDETI